MAMGRKAAEETDKQMVMLDAPLLTAYVNNLGQKVAQASRRPQIQYTFKIVNTDDGQCLLTARRIRLRLSRAHGFCRERK